MQVGDGPVRLQGPFGLGPRNNANSGRASWSRDTCESPSGFYVVLGTTWAPWSRDTCERLSGIYLVLGTTWASPGGRKQIAYVMWRVWKAPLLARSTSSFMLLYVSDKESIVGVAAIMF